LRDQQHAPAVPPIRQHARDGHQQQRRNLARETDDPQQPRRVRQPIDEPPHRNLLHPCAGEGDGLAGEIEAEVPMAEGPEDLLQVRGGAVERGLESQRGNNDPS